MMVATLIFAATGAKAHDIYSELQDRFGASCCNETDCRPANYRVTTSGIEMLLDDDWVRIPNEVIQYRTLHGDTGETRGGHWCGGAKIVEPGIFTRCVILPPGLF
jgi:hypothetical protein